MPSGIIQFLNVSWSPHEMSNGMDISWGKKGLLGFFWKDVGRLSPTVLPYSQAAMTEPATQKPVVWLLGLAWILLSNSDMSLLESKPTSSNWSKLKQSDSQVSLTNPKSILLIFFYHCFQILSFWTYLWARAHTHIDTQKKPWLSLK